MRILVVDDSLLTRTILRDMLAMLGHTVVGEAASQAQALAAYQAQKPDVVTLDMNLGQDNGMDVLKAVRAMDPEAKVMVLTDNPTLQAQAREAGAYGFAKKPIAIDDLKAVILRSKPQKLQVSKPTEQELAGMGLGKAIDQKQWRPLRIDKGVFEWKYDDEETCYFYDGHALINTADGTVDTRKGDLIVFPIGLKCTLAVLEPVTVLLRRPAQ